MEKKTPGEWRSCLDARPVNEALRYEHFNKEGMVARQLIRRDDWLTTLDITEAHPRLLVVPEQRLVWEGIHYQYRALYFGLAPTPRIFTKNCSFVGQAFTACPTSTTC